VEGECDAELPLDDATDCLTITVGQPKLGRMFDYMDQPLDGLGPFTKEEGNDKEVLVRKLPVFNAEPTKGSTTSLHRSLLTGITAVDALTPLGRGQTMLVNVCASSRAHGVL
jgi:F-type H+-transporting ATPase subunit alpha